ncbi:hypothetical protein MSAN_00113700 [Mycena sanguinolenta]|uniref:Uncharacterized protein n=1 Tax=Mycena sanguinolenta TaxID=230812 RepID=A0A8H7DIT8_9AGAR|nr:hypothetical protein MSAN_00113700 [Mycena sanguinolenta]
MHPLLTEFLTVLRLWVAPHELTDLVDHLLMPQLRHFQVAPPAYSHPNVTNCEFLECLATNSPLLSALGLCFDFTDCSHVLATLQRLLHLTKLTLSCSRPEQNATPLASLSPGPDAPIPLPQLLDLELVDSIWLEDIFLRFIETQLKYKPTCGTSIWLSGTPLLL